MSCFIIAGKADDPSFARAEFAAKEVKAIHPNVFFRLEMKHPDMWKDFLIELCRQYDFAHIREDFSGPLVWSLEGDLIGNAADFVQKICIEKFGIKDPPSVTDPIFKLIAADNLKQVKQQLQRETNGPPLAERYEAVRIQAASLLQPAVFSSQQRLITNGACMEVWTCPSLPEQITNMHKEYGSGQSARVDPGLQVCKVGQEQSHVLLLHPKPLASKHLVLVPTRYVREITVADELEATISAEGDSREDADQKPTFDDASKADQKPTFDDASKADQKPTFDDSSKVTKLEIPPSQFRSDYNEDLSLQDFLAAIELLSVGGVATWAGIREGLEYRHPLDTYIQVLPFPLHTAGESSPLRYPLELYLERAAREGKASLPLLPFRHFFSAVPTAEGKATVAEQAKAALTVYESAVASFGINKSRQSQLLAFTSTWLFLVPLAPPDVDSPRIQAWLTLPPPHPCALCGVFVIPPIEPNFPETTGLAENHLLLSHRAEEEGIPSDAPEFVTAVKEVRISSKIVTKPVKLIEVWAFPLD